jgi:hypothetical protein
LRSFLLLALQAPALDHANQDHHDRDDQERMNEPAHRVRSDKAQEPQDYQDDCNGFEHLTSPFPIDMNDLANRESRDPIQKPRRRWLVSMILLRFGAPNDLIKPMRHRSMALLVLADFMPDDAADDCTADGAHRAAARENGASDSTGTSADSGALVLP